jgi:hypothetical protein
MERKYNPDNEDHKVLYIHSAEALENELSINPKKIVYPIIRTAGCFCEIPCANFDDGVNDECIFMFRSREYWMNINARVAILIGTYLQLNNVQQLSLLRIVIKPDAYKILLSAIEKTTMLQELSIVSKKEEDIINLINSLYINKSVTSLRIQSPNITQDVFNKLVTLLKTRVFVKESNLYDLLFIKSMTFYYCEFTDDCCGLEEILGCPLNMLSFYGSFMPKNFNIINMFTSLISNKTIETIDFDGVQYNIQNPNELFNTLSLINTNNSILSNIVLFSERKNIGVIPSVDEWMPCYTSTNDLKRKGVELGIEQCIASNCCRPGKCNGFLPTVGSLEHLYEYGSIPLIFSLADYTSLIRINGVISDYELALTDPNKQLIKQLYNRQRSKKVTLLELLLNIIY